MYVKDVTREGTGVKPGDVLTRIGGVAADNMSVKEAKKLMDQSKERLSIVVTREVPASCGAQQQGKGEGGEYLSGASYSSQNLYVPPPTRQPLEEKSTVSPRGRSRGPLMDVSLSQLDLPATPTVDPPRPPPPRPEGCGILYKSFIILLMKLLFLLHRLLQHKEAVVRRRSTGSTNQATNVSLHLRGNSTLCHCIKLYIMYIITKILICYNQARSSFHNFPKRGLRRSEIDGWQRDGGVRHCRATG